MKRIANTMASDIEEGEVVDIDDAADSVMNVSKKLIIVHLCFVFMIYERVKLACIVLFRRSRKTIVP